MLSFPHPIPLSTGSKLVVESRDRCRMALELLIFLYGNGLVNQKELSSQIIPLLLWGGKTASESKRGDQLQERIPCPGTTMEDGIKFG